MCRLTDYALIVRNLLFIALNLDFHSLIQITQSQPNPSSTMDFPKHFLLVIVLLSEFSLIKVKYTDTNSLSYQANKSVQKKKTNLFF